MTYALFKVLDWTGFCREVLNHPVALRLLLQLANSHPTNEKFRSLKASCEQSIIIFD